MTKHQELKKNTDYNVNYFCGYPSEFDGARYFLENEGVDVIIDRKSYSINHPNHDYAARTWGYPDKDVFEKSLLVKDSLKDDKFFDIYLTTTMHAPFIYNNVAAAMIHDTVRYCVHDDDISYRVLKNTVYPVHHNNVGYIF